LDSGDVGDNKMKLLQLAEKFLTAGKFLLVKFILMTVLGLAILSVYVNLIIRGI